MAKQEKKQYSQDHEMSYEEAEYWCQIEAEQCTCQWDEVRARPIQDGCLWHSEAAQMADEQEKLAEMEDRPGPAARAQAGGESL
jgi:hypothetical protein